MSKNENPANEYRAERKKRLSKKSKTSTVDSVKVVSVIVGIIAALAVISLVGFGLYQFGIPHKVLPAVKVNDKTYSVAEYGFYYSSVFQSMAEQTNALGMNAFDFKKDPSLQTTTDEDGNQITYDQLIRNKVIDTLEAQNYYLDKCTADGIVLDDAKKEEIEKTVSEIAQYAKQYGYSTSRYISLLYGKGMNEKTFRELLENQFLVAQCIETEEKNLYDGISEDDIEEAYEKDAAKYQAADIRLFAFEKDEADKTPVPEATTEESTSSSEETTAPADETPAPEEEKEPTKQEILANEMLGKITDEASFNKLAYEYSEEKDKHNFENADATLIKNIKQPIVESNIGKDMAEWLFSADRQVGDKTVYSAKDFVYIVYIVKTAYRNDEPLVNARHILVSFDAVAQSLKNKDGNTVDVEKDDKRPVENGKTEEELDITNKDTGYSIELVTEAYKAARDILDEYRSGEPTEEAFAALANKYSADTGSAGEKGNGGLYENIERGKMVKPFEDWVYAADRKPGDVDIVMTNYGWHVMYFVSKNEAPAWEEDVRTALGNEAFAEYEKEIEEASKDTGSEAAFANFAGNEACKLMTKLYAEQPHADHQH